MTLPLLSSLKIAENVNFNIFPFWNLRRFASHLFLVDNPDISLLNITGQGNLYHFLFWNFTRFASLLLLVENYDLIFKVLQEM